MAEGLLKAKIGGDKAIKVSSAGVAAMPGQDASHETQVVLKLLKAPLKKFKSRQVNEKILTKADLIIAMTHSHAEALVRFFPEKSESVRLLTDFIDLDECLEGADVPDPIGMGLAAYEEVADVMKLALPGIIKFIKDNH